MSWCTIESDPGVFTELIEELGVRDTQVSEIYSFEAVEDWQKEGCQGLIYLFRYTRDEDPRPVVDPPEGMFFARQIVQDACGTQALLSVLLNTPEAASEGGSPNCLIGSALSEFREFTMWLDPESRGIEIGNHERIRTVHNSFARPEPFVMDEEDKKNRKGKEQEAFHFVAYVPFRGHVYEMDGLKPGPIYIGEVPASEGTSAWLDVARPAIEARMQRADDIKSVLLALGRSKEAMLNARLAAGNDLPDDSINMDLLECQENRKRQREENVLRRHNFFPFILQLARGLAQKGMLAPLVDAAKAKKTRAAEAVKK
jgi:ubiquitin carboxyl-terminal hydrolase L5